MTLNEGLLDRALRVLLGVTLIALAVAGVVEAPVAVGLFVVGVAALATGVAGWCPGYALTHWDTHCTHS